jgi:L-alanine-DL-glutamate epimerase-like enolase superfamily enzyme
MVFLPSVAEETRQQWIDAESDFMAGLIGRDIKSIMLLAREIQELEKSWSGVALGLETVYFDIQGKLKGETLTELLGERRSDDMIDYFSISEKSEQKIRERVGLAGADRVVFQLKLGIGDEHADIKQVTLIQKLIDQNQIVLADANGGWSTEKACHIIEQFDDDRIVWEEPCKTYQENSEVAKITKQPIMVDQCVGNIDLAMQAIDDRVAAAICIKPAFLGGLTQAMKVRDHCVGANIKMRIDGPWCGDIATAANLHLAAGVPPNLLIASCDLREPLLLEQNLHGVVNSRPGRIAPPVGPGVGISFDAKLFGRPQAVYC